MDDETRLKKLRAVQNLNTVAFIAAPVSLLIGGVLLGAAALVCAIVAFVKVRAIKASAPRDEVTLSLYRQSAIALAVTGSIFVVNCVWFAMAFTMMMDILQSGDYSQLLDTFGMSDGTGTEGSGSGSSVWD